ncbi:hypothetical protein BDV96DRAFT_668507 [Lophiotrema nucula]|uniref:Jacalin-type lectin domain-containing protein n=1 Tax=Lophiotrema nucula TaxID=690887 RepID=A0A6A5YS72_9PLEO|nr:hypothetical protein BDV96DRAFT_668507 [Lophiotrema nucula]
MVSFRHVATSFSMALLASSVASAEDISVPLKDCQLDIVTSRTFGSSAGTPWCAMQLKNGDLINKISVWTKKIAQKYESAYQIRGLRVQYSSDKSTMIGGEEGTLSEHEWTPLQFGPVKGLGEHNLMLKDSDHLEGYLLDTDKGHTLSTLMIEWPGVAIVAGGRAGVNDWPRTMAYLENCGPGYEDYWSDPIEGEVIEQITFHMLSADISSIAVHDVVSSPSIEETNARTSNECAEPSFPTFQEVAMLIIGCRDRGMELQTLKSVIHVNERDNTDTTFRLIDTVTRRDWTTWPNTTSNLQHYGLGVEISHNWSGIFSKLDVTGKGDFYWDHSNEKTNLTGSKDSAQLSINMETVVKPKTAVHGWAYTVEGHQNVEWSGKATLDFADDHTLEFDVGRHLENVQHMQAWSHFEDLSPEQVKGNVKGILDSGEAELVDENGETITPTSRSKMAKRFDA